jgi:ribosomal protein L34E
MGWADDGRPGLRALEREARVETEPSLPLVARWAREVSGGPGCEPCRDALLHGVNRTRSDDLCKRGSNTLELLR